MESLIAYSLISVVTIYSIWVVVSHAAKMGVRRYTGMNDDSASKDYFLLLLNEAKHKMIVFDDGDAVENSIYWDDDVLDAIAEKIHENPKFTLQCLFNCPVPEPFNRFEQEPRIDARTNGLGDTAPRDVHLKIIDDGTLSYLSKHEFSSRTRRFELVDCRTVYFWALKGVAKFELENRVDWFDQTFQQASAA